MTLPSAQCMDVGPQAEVADGTAMGDIQAADKLSAEGTPTPRKATKRLARFTTEV